MTINYLQRFSISFDVNFPFVAKGKAWKVEIPLFNKVIEGVYGRESNGEINVSSSNHKSFTFTYNDIFTDKKLIGQRNLSILIDGQKIENPITFTNNTIQAKVNKGITVLHGKLFPKMETFSEHIDKISIIGGNKYFNSDMATYKVGSAKYGSIKLDGEHKCIEFKHIEPNDLNIDNTLSMNLILNQNKVINNTSFAGLTIGNYYRFNAIEDNWQLFELKERLTSIKQVKSTTKVQKENDYVRIRVKDKVNHFALRIEKDGVFYFQKITLYGRYN